MNCYKIINRFWRLHNEMRFSPVEFAVFHYIVRRYDVNRGKNPIAIPTLAFEESLGISRSRLAKAREVLRDRGLITFITGSRTQTPVYTLLDEPFFTPVNGTDCGTDYGTDYETDYVSSDNTLSNISKESKMSKDSKESKEEKKENISNTREEVLKFLPEEKTSEQKPLAGELADSDLMRFDRLAAEVREGRHQIWSDQMAKRYRIASVNDYLDSFRAHTIANATIGRIRDINDFKRYFNLAFRYFSPESPASQLDRREAEAPADAEEFHKYCRWMRERLPRLANGLEPITLKQFDFLFSIYPKQQIVDTIWALNDNPHVLDRHRTLYEPLCQWLDRRYRKK